MSSKRDRNERAGSDVRTHTDVTDVLVERGRVVATGFHGRGITNVAGRRHRRSIAR